VRTSQLPTAGEILANAARCLDEAYGALGDAGDWLRSDWRPADAPLTEEQARLRQRIFAAITTAKEATNNAKRGGE